MSEGTIRSERKWSLILQCLVGACNDLSFTLRRGTGRGFGAEERFDMI